MTTPDEYSKRKAYFQKYHKERHRKLHDSCIQKLGGICACCGEKEPLFLEIDHVNNDGNKLKVKLPGGVWDRGDYHFMKSIVAGTIDCSSLQVLCANCNHGKYRNGGVCPHTNV